MANPTTNFGWQMPTPTDLVTDLPADFEVFGQAVDTDFVDLLGGTTGQVLSKTSGYGFSIHMDRARRNADIQSTNWRDLYTLVAREMLENLSPHQTRVQSRLQFRHLFSQPETSLTFNQ
jgi:hypothetical protein